MTIGFAFYWAIIGFHCSGYITKPERSITKQKLAISCLTMSIEYILYNMILKFDNKNIHFRSKTDLKRMFFVSFSTCHYEDVYLNTGFSYKTEIAGADRPGCSVMQSKDSC